MCNSCSDNTSTVIPLGPSGKNGLNGNPGVPFIATECPIIFDSALLINYTCQDFIDTIPLDFNNIPDYTAYRTIAYFIFPGTSNLANIIPNNLQIVGNVSSSNWLVRIRNSNDITIAGSTSIITTIKGLINIGTVSNLPTNMDIFTIEVFPTDLTDPTSILTIDSVLLNKI